VTLEIDVLTLFPTMVSGPLAESIPGRIQERGLVTVRTRDLREFGLGRHRSVDDTPYGGGAGMVMRVEPIVAAIEAVKRPDSLVILMDPGGEVFSQARAADLANRGHLVFVCPRYEGVDERIRSFVDMELSIGDYVVTGGELPALVVIDAVMRLLPGATSCRRPRSRSAPACSSTRSTRGRRRTAVSMCRRSSRRATTERLRTGGGSGPWSGPANADPIC
jgi:tRNA (guanine37-N1)-methyltransferase